MNQFEPSTFESNASDALSSIAYCKIHPGIGIARLGDSHDEFFIGPQVPGFFPVPKDSLFKDSHGKVKRQAVKFYVFAYDSNKKVIKEITAEDNCTINWKVHLSNKKGDTKLFVGKFNQTDEVRNKDIINRKELVIDPGSRSITGINQSGDKYKFDTGKFMDIVVPLGELRTDEKGRLIVLGGFGKSGSTDINKYPVQEYANNDGWYDDTSDGPVTASVTLNNADKTIIPIRDSAWVIVAPPKFAPYHYPLVTLYDTMLQVAYEQGWIAKPDRVSFTKDIFPIFSRVINHKWLNEDAEKGHGINGPGSILARFNELSNNGKDSTALRQLIFSRIRNPMLIDNPTSRESIRQAEPIYMPLLSGDDGEFEEGKIRTFMTLLPFQYENLRRWSTGDFISDFDASTLNNNLDEKFKKLAELPVEEQPYALDKSSLEPAIGGPFYPGIEITFIAREPSIYDGKAFRINQGLEPGEITKFMAIPWQADFLLCKDYWWPTARPDDVIPEGITDEIVNHRRKWARNSDNLEFNKYSEMVDKWSTLGFIKPKKVGNDTFFIESERR